LTKQHEGPPLTPTGTTPSHVSPYRFIHGYKAAIEKREASDASRIRSQQDVEREAEAPEWRPAPTSGGLRSIKKPRVHLAPVRHLITETYALIYVLEVWMVAVDLEEKLPTEEKKHALGIDPRRPLELHVANFAPCRTTPNLDPLVIRVTVRKALGHVLREVANRTTIVLVLEDPIATIEHDLVLAPQPFDPHLLPPTTIRQEFTETDHVYIVITDPVEVPSSLLGFFPEEKVIHTLAPQPVKQRLAPGDRNLVIRTSVIGKSVGPEISPIMSSDEPQNRPISDEPGLGTGIAQEGLSGCARSIFVEVFCQAPKGL